MRCAFSSGYAKPCSDLRLVEKGSQEMHARTASGQCKTADMPSGAVVLVIDDAAVADALALLLTIAGHSPIVATGFDEAQHALLGAERMPDVIICDQLLARIQSGFKTIERIRGLATHPIPAIVLTDCVTWSATREKRGRIEDCYKLNKPFDGDKLLAFIASTLNSATRKHLALISQDDCVLLESKLRSKVTG